MVSWITVCDTCKRDGWDPEQSPMTDGEQLATLVEAVADGQDTIAVRRHSCLMGCDGACNVTIQGADKINYTIGRFEPTEEVAQAITEYAKLHSESENGQVPYRQWPQPVKGHFVSRHPPMPRSDD